MRERRSLLQVGIASVSCYGALAAYYVKGLPPCAWWIALHTIVAVLLFYLYCRGWLALQRAGQTNALVVGFAVIFALLALLLPAFYSKDLYCYVNIGWAQF